VGFLSGKNPVPSDLVILLIGDDLLDARFLQVFNGRYTGATRTDDGNFWSHILLFF
jgi:hypothetical protein